MTRPNPHESSQQNWWDLQKGRTKEEARKFLADALREAADQVEDKDYPDVYGCCTKPPDDPKFGPPFIWTVAVTLSYPWPG